MFYQLCPFTRIAFYLYEILNEITTDVRTDMYTMKGCVKGRCLVREGWVGGVGGNTYRRDVRDLLNNMRHK